MRVVFFGTPDFAVESLDAIMQSGHEVAAVVTVPDRQAGRGQKVIYSAVKEYALAHSLPLLQPEKLRDPAFIDALAAYKADVFVVVAFRMLPEAVWNMPPHGTFNLHASLLPRYRGAAPINWAIINGEQESGVTTFLLNHQIDEGAILLQERTPIAPDETAGSLHDRLAAMGRSLVVRTLDGMAANTLTPLPQQGEACPAPKIFKAGFLNSCEMIFTCWNKKHTWNFISQAEMHNFIESPICMRPERLANPKHPAQKPVSILKKMIKIASNMDDIIFDPFMGVGSTGVAALELDRRFIGVELDKSYFDAAKVRIESIINNMPDVVESLVIDEGGKMVALIYPDLEGAAKDGLTTSELIEAKMNENIRIVNEEMPNYSKISSVKIMPEEFEKTPKRSIKRYIYQK